MSFARILRPELIKLRLATVADPEQMEDPERGLRYRRALKEAVLGEIADLFEENGVVANRSKLHTDFIHREKKASTALGRGVAIPHVRTMQVRAFAVGFLRSPEGIWFDAADDGPVHVFFAMAAPPYDDQKYLKTYRQIGKAMEEYPEMIEALRTAETAEEVRRLVRYYLGG